MSMAEPDEMLDECTVMPNQWSLTVGLIASAILMLGFLGVSRWIAAFLLVIFLTCLFQIFRPAPIVRATREGLYLSVGTFGRTFCVPWERVDAVVLTKVVPVGPEARPKDALGFVIRQDDEFKLPAFQWNSSGRDQGPPHSDVTFSRDMIDGDVKAWVRKLEAFRKCVRHWHAPAVTSDVSITNRSLLT